MDSVNITTFQSSYPNIRNYNQCQARFVLQILSIHFLLHIHKMLELYLRIPPTSFLSNPAFCLLAPPPVPYLCFLLLPLLMLRCSLCNYTILSSLLFSNESANIFLDLPYSNSQHCKYKQTSPT